MRKTTGLIILLSIAGKVTAQSTYLPLGTDEYRLLDRIEAKDGQLNPLLNSTLKPYSRQEAITYLNEYKEFTQVQFNTVSNRIDDYNTERAISISGEWGKAGINFDATLPSKRPLLKYIYATQPNFYMYSDEQFFLVINPVIHAQAGIENGGDGFKYIFSRGGEVRARIMNKIGVYTYLAEHQEKLPSYFESVASRWQAFPGNDYSSGGGTSAHDALVARGYVDFPIYKKYVNATFGYDKQFIGDGIRSLFLSNSGAASTFLRIRYQMGRFTYQNLYMELMPDYYGRLDRILPRKYATMHYLGVHIGKKLNVGLFESTIFNSGNNYNAAYLVPVILYRTVSQGIEANGHKTALGLNFKYLPVKNVQVYGQFYANSVDFQGISQGSWKNQFATQLGAKYFDAFTLPNLDIQLEWNRVRPYTYAAMDSVVNYTHYNQPLAHPMESSFNEVILSAYYQPIPKAAISLKGIYSRKTQNDPQFNEGASVFNPMRNRVNDFTPGLIGNNFVDGLYGNLNIAYELKPNLYVEAGATLLHRTMDNTFSMPTSSFIYGGIRLNVQRREYDWF